MAALRSPFRRRRAGLLAALVMAILSPCSAVPQELAASSSLYSQAVSTMLNRSFPSTRVEYLLLDLRTGQPIATRWAHPDTPIPVGSLLKPFVALAYSQLPLSSAGESAFPVVYCRGKRDGCWHEGGHGSMTLESALAQSCNAYFLALAREISTSGSGLHAEIAALHRVGTAYALPATPAPGDASMLIGATPEWRIAPLALARAYAALTTHTEDSTVRRLLAGMRMAAMPGGTAAAAASNDGQVSGDILAKTGTAPCRSTANAPCVASGDGLVVVITPAETPRLLLLLRERGTTGAQTAALAGSMLARLEGLHVVSR